MAQVGLEHLTKVFPGPGERAIPAVNDACLVVEDKELLVLVGPSGCGKTTTLRLIAGLEAPTAGTILLNGQVVNHLPPKKRDVAMVFQDYALYPHLSVYDNLAFGLKLRRCPRAEIEQRISHAVQLLGLADCLDRRPNALSGGQCQRVALGRALVRRPQVFLLDEPLSNLDAQTRSQLRAEIVRLHARLGATMIYVTHDQVEALTLGHRVALMKDGVIQQVATPADLYHKPANRFVAGFIGSPPMNFIEGTVIDRGQTCVFEPVAPGAAPGGQRSAFALDQRAPAKLREYVGKSVVCGIRPEHVKCTPASPDAPAGQGSQAVVEAVQNLGSETLVHLAAGGQMLIARVTAAEPCRAGQAVRLSFDPSRAYFFDPATGAAV